MKDLDSSRRNFLAQLGAVAGASWLNAQWPAIAEAAQHAHEAKQSTKPYTFEVLTAQQAKAVEAMAARIIPTDELPGATEAGVVYFIDRALKTFAQDSVAAYRAGLLMVDQTTSKLFPGVTHFSSAAAEQQDQVLTEIAGAGQNAKRASPFGPPAGNDFFQLVWTHTTAGFLADPETGGNRNYVGWQVIGRDPAHVFSPPFGWYDRDYPGWEKLPQDGTDKR